jgi:paraquat-inducible protein B
MKKTPLIIGTFVLAAMALIVASVIAIGGKGLFTKQLKAVVYFDGNVRSLYVGAPVTFRGVKIGDVDSIGIEVGPTTLATRIPVGLSLGTGTLRMGGPDGQRLSNVPDLVRRGLRAQLILQSVVTGQTAVDLDFKPETPLHLQGGGHRKTPEIWSTTSGAPWAAWTRPSRPRIWQCQAPASSCMTPACKPTRR